jgi:hypothetical protein
MRRRRELFETILHVITTVAVCLSLWKESDGKLMRGDALHFGQPGLESHLVSISCAGSCWAPLCLALLCLLSCSAEVCPWCQPDVPKGGPRMLLLLAVRLKYLTYQKIEPARHPCTGPRACGYDVRAAESSGIGLGALTIPWLVAALLAAAGRAGGIGGSLLFMVSVCLSALSALGKHPFFIPLSY